MDFLAFNGGTLDRAGEHRSDAAWVAAQAQAGLFLPVFQGKPLVADGRVVLLPWRDAWDGRTRVLLGLDGAQAIFAIDAANEVPPIGAYEEMRAAFYSRKKTKRTDGPTRPENALNVFSSGALRKPAHAVPSNSAPKPALSRRRD